jgi:hypothetical protein
MDGMDYGNTSSSSTYYVLAYMESLVGIKKGEKLMQVWAGVGVSHTGPVCATLISFYESSSAWHAAPQLWHSCRCHTKKHGAFTRNEVRKCQTRNRSGIVWNKSGDRYLRVVCEECTP